MAEWAKTPASRIVNFSLYTEGDGVLNSSASANTKGSYELLDSSIDYSYDMLTLTFSPNTLQTRDFLTDIAIGGAGSEQVIIANLLHSASTNWLTTTYHVPIHIPKGARLSARTQCSTGSSNVELFVHGTTASFNEGVRGGRVETWGAATGDSGGTSIDPGGSQGVFGSYSQLIASTAFDVRWIIVALGNQTNASRSTTVGDLDVAIGAGGSEQGVLTGVRFVTNATPDDVLPHTFGPFPVSIKAGTRVAARCVNYSTATSPARLIDCIVYGIG